MIGYLFGKNIITSEQTEKAGMLYGELLSSNSCSLGCQNYYITVRLEIIFILPRLGLTINIQNFGML